MLMDRTGSMSTVLANCQRMMIMSLLISFWHQGSHLSNMSLIPILVAAYR